MSVREAAGCALSSSQSVSVVPMIQCRPHGMTNSTLVSVRRISPVDDWIRSRGTTRWTPLDARTWNWPRSPTIAWVIVGPDAGRVDHLPGAHLDLGVGLEVADPDAGHPLALAQEADHPGPVGDQRAVGRGGADHGSGVPGVVDLRVVVLDGADQGVLAQRRRLPQRRRCGSGAGGGGSPRALPDEQAHGVVERDAGADVQPLPAAVLAAGRGTAPGAPGAARAAGSAGRARAAPPGPGRSRASPGSAGRRGSACWTGSTYRPPSRGPRTAPTVRPRVDGVQRDAGADHAAADDDDVELVEPARRPGPPAARPGRAGWWGRTARGPRSGSCRIGVLTAVRRPIVGLGDPAPRRSHTLGPGSAAGPQISREPR